MAWNKPTSSTVGATSSSRPAGRGKMPRLRRGLFAGLVVVALGAFCLYLFSNGEATSPSLQKKERGRIREVTPAAAPVYKEDTNETAQLRKIDARNLERARKLAKMTPDERLDFLFEEAQKRPLDLEPTTNRPFKTSTEVQLARIFSTDLGDMPPPNIVVPIEDEAHMAEIIVANNPVIAGDSDQVVAEKASVEAAKKELKKFIKDGGDVSDFLTYYRGVLDEAFQKRVMAQESVFKTIRDDPDIAHEYFKEVNKRLESEGIRPTVVPPEMRAKLGWDED